MSKGKIIVLEGLDGCGKSTQLELLVEALKKRGLPVRLVSFPNYNSDAGRIITDYLHGNIPCDESNGAYAASSFYAIDRYISYATDWKKDYDNGTLIICGRYTTSNAIYQMTKLDENECGTYMNWLWDHEYNKLGIPEPDMVIFLDMPLNVSQKLLSVRYEGDEGKKDIHERNLDFMKKCHDSALFAAEKCAWRMVSCSDGAEPYSIEDIHCRVLSLAEELING